MKKKYVIDIDDTICIEKGPVISRVPYRDRIKKVNELYDKGHTIIFYTARGFVSKVDFLDLTTKQLTDWGVNYDKIYMGKPNADYYIDDKNEDPFGWFKK